jgi:myo-inositol catabolism protein IolC
MLEAYGLKPKAQEIDKMKPRQCPNCSELNKIDSKFCVKCRMILSYDSYMETVKQQEERTDERIKAFNTITLVAERMAIFEKALIDSGILDDKRLSKLEDEAYQSFKTKRIE